MSFTALGLRPELLKGVAATGYLHPTPIQAQAIPVALQGRDFLGAAQTGTGKTAVFILPILQRFLDRPKSCNGPRALVLEPTRELAAQVETCVRDYGRFTRFRCAVVIGGVGIGPQIDALRRHPEIVVATPGRLLDHLERGTVSLRDVEMFVLDEADRLLDLGFARELDRITALVPARRQTMLFSATLPPEIQALCRMTLMDPVNIEVGPRAVPAAGITHAVYPVTRARKFPLLLELLRNPAMSSVLVFTRTKRGADRLARHLEQARHSVGTIHGDLSQLRRQEALEGFRKGRYQLLVATDIAARGLDIDGITHVINYDVPGHPEDYVHRVGRTARMAARGDAFTLVEPEETDQLRRIERYTGQPIPRVLLPGFEYGIPENVLKVLVPTAQSAAPSKPGGSLRRPGLVSGFQGRRFRSRRR